MKTIGISSQRKIKHVPKRTCVACRNTFEKKDLIRLVWTAGGTVEPDVSGKLPGRGAYLCRNPECWTDGCKGNKLERAFKTEINRTNKEQLIEWINKYLEAENK